MFPGWSAEKVGSSYLMISTRVAAERLNNELRPQDPGGGDIRIVASRVETTALPVNNDGCVVVQNRFVFPQTWGHVERSVL